jgi:flagellar protein FliO/FliZ
VIAPAAAVQTVWPGAGGDGGLYGLAVATAVVVLVAMLAWLFRRGTIRFGPRQARVAMKIESGLSLGERRALAIVTVEGRRLLIGLAPGHVSLLTELAALPPSFERTLDQKREGTS